MNKLKSLKLLIIFYLIFSLASCSLYKERVITKVEYKYIYPQKCVKPSKPILKKLNKNLPLTSSENIKILISDLIDIKAYTKSLEATIECYELQIDKMKNKEVQNDNRKHRTIKKMDRGKRN